VLSILLVGAGFIAWDVWFTSMGVWGFNPRYLTGIYLLGLPVEEWMFFVTVPFACVFVYEVLQLFVPRDVLGSTSKWIALVLILFTAGLFILHWDHWYTASATGLCAVLLFLHAFVLKSPWLGRFFLAFAVNLIPFLLVNGILTGTGIDQEVVWYNNDENMGFRILTIPFEDVFYGMDLLLLNTWLYLAFSNRNSAAQVKLSAEASR